MSHMGLTNSDTTGLSNPRSSNFHKFRDRGSARKLRNRPKGVIVCLEGDVAHVGSNHTGSMMMMTTRMIMVMMMMMMTTTTMTMVFLMMMLFFYNYIRVLRISQVFRRRCCHISQHVSHPGPKRPSKHHLIVQATMLDD